MSKKKVSEIERGVGFLQGLVSGMMAIAEEKGVPFEAIYRLGTPAGKSTLVDIIDLAHMDWKEDQPKSSPLHQTASQSVSHGGQRAGFYAAVNPLEGK